MKVAIEARALESSGSGVHTYVRHLIDALPVAAPRHEFSVVSGAPQSAVRLPWWFAVTLPREIARQAPDVVHFTKAAVPRGVVQPVVVTIYDVIPLLVPAGQRWLQRMSWPRVLAQAAHRSRHILTISETSKRDIVQRLGVTPERISVTPLAVDRQRFSPAAASAVAEVRARYGLTRPYVLYVGQLEPRKNVPLLVRAFARSAAGVPHDLILAGRAYHKEKEITAAVRAAGLETRVRMLGYVPGDDLPALYSGADVFVWPSVYEGWAFPVQEAMSCGTPVVVSNGGAIPEVVGGAGIIVPFTTGAVSERAHDTVFEEQLARELGELLSDAGRRVQLGTLGREQVARFSWEAVARATVGVYEQVAQEAL